MKRVKVNFVGFPGWHIECSAMSMKYLGKTLDIHTGGVDHIAVHHTNEIAQSESITSKKFVRYWMHNEFVMINGQKISKSLRNYYILNDLMEKGFSPLAFRYLCLSVHYRSQMNFTWDSLQRAQETLDKFNDFYSKVQWLSQLKVRNGWDTKKIAAAEKEFGKHINNDLDTVHALSTLHELITDFNAALDSGRIGSSAAKEMLLLLKKINSVFAVIDEKEEKITPEERKLIVQREKLRKKKKFADADGIRENLRKRGILIEDTPYGPRWKRS